MNYKSLIARLFVLFSIVLFSSDLIAQGDPVKGKELFATCGACHNKNMKDKMVGPPLAGIRERWAGKEDLLKEWIRNPQAVLDKKDEYALKIFEEYNKFPMTPSANLSDQDIDDILAYVDSKSGGAKKAASGGSNSSVKGDWEHGKELYASTACGACHNKNMKDKLVGPGLGDVQKRWAGKEDLLKKWIKNPQEVLDSGDEYANKLFADFNKTPMTPSPNLSDSDIDDILAYIHHVYAGETEAKTETGGSDFADDGFTPEDTTKLAFDNPKKTATPWLTYFNWLFALVLGAIVVKLASNVKAYNAQDAGDTDAKPKTWMRSFIGFGVFLATVFLFYGWYVSSVQYQRQQGYQPTQPINFSHKLHAGDYKIDCNFCHDGARRSKHSIIPAAGTCMKCHTAITKGSRWGTGELTKIFASVGFDPSSGKYLDNPESLSAEEYKNVYTKYLSSANEDAALVEKQWNDIESSLTTDLKKTVYGPIPWVRIHNLPDHVYYNHSQHVTVGQLECQTCHGPVEKMDIVSQYAPLSMGWCVNCHRETEVKFEGNDYYKAYSKFHEEINEGKRSKVTVEDIGGTECQKCHY